MRCITDQEKGYVIQLSGACYKTDEPVLDMLREKHPEDRAISDRSSDAYPFRPP